MASYTWSLIAVAALAVISAWGVPFLLAEYFPWRSLWKQRHGKPSVTTKSYQGRTALITGANGAFGSRSARIFAHRDVETLVLVDVRSCEGLKEQIQTELKEVNKKVPNILVWEIDMMTFKGCQTLAKKARELKNLDHALMTMGILAFNRRDSPEGWETSIQVNYLSTALVALLLLPILKSSSSNPSPPVITFCTTFGIWPASFTMGVPKNGSYLRKLSTNKEGMDQAHQYGRSKGALLYFARELAARVSAAETRGKGFRKVTVNSADPGSAWTGLTNPNQGKLIPRLIMNFGARDPQICATAITNGVSASADSHGKIMQDFETGSYPPFMERKSGQVAQQRLWDETRSEFEAKVPEVKAVYEMLDY